MLASHHRKAGTRVEPSKAGKRKGGGGFGATLCDLSPALQAFLGVQQESRPQIVKKIWDYIKANNLQDPSDRRKIRYAICVHLPKRLNRAAPTAPASVVPDENLKPIFPTTVTMFSMNKVLSKHIHTAEGNGPGSSKKPSKKRRNDSEEDATDEDEEAEYCAPKAKKGGGGGGFTKQLQLSAELAEATGNETMSRPELTKWFTNYWKVRRVTVLVLRAGVGFVAPLCLYANLSHGSPVLSDAAVTHCARGCA
eukprot:366009-Chlamydomonas_euryale.AAC.10